MRTTVKVAIAGLAALCWAALPVPGSGTAKAAEGVEHRIRSGDNLHLIAGYYYKDPRQWKRIWRANRAAIRQPNLLSPGKVLRVETQPGQGWDIPYEEFVAQVFRR